MKKDFKYWKLLNLRGKKFFSIMMGADKKDVFLSLFISVMSGVLGTVSLGVSKYFVNELINVFKCREITEKLIGVLIASFGIALACVLFNHIGTFVMNRLSDKLSVYVTQHVLEKVIELPMNKFDDSETYNKIQLTIQETPDRCLLLVSSLQGILKEVIQLVGVLGILLKLHWLLGILPIVVFIPLFKIEKNMKMVWFQVQHKRMENKRYSEEMKSIILKNENIKELKLYGISNYLLEKSIKLQKKFDREDLNNTQKYMYVNTIAAVIDGLYSLGIKFWVVVKTLRKKQTIGSASMYITAIDTYGNIIQNILEQYSIIMEQMLYIGYICEIDEMEREDEKLEVFNEEIEEIEFRNVSFKYPNMSEYVLKNISFILRTNYCYGIVGVNGSGKTTLIKLLMKLYVPEQGEIYINGKNIANIKGKSLRKYMSAIFQDFIKYPFSIKENICLDNEYIDEERMKEIASSIGLDKDILKMPKGYDSQLNCEWTEGVNLSGGQWQKIAVTRCLYRKSNLLIFDEPFSWIDHITEGKIIKKMKQLKRGKINLLISHQFDMMPMLDEIIVLQQGEIAEMGTHVELLKKRGVYYSLINAEQNI